VRADTLPSHSSTRDAIRACKAVRPAAPRRAGADISRVERREHVGVLRHQRIVHRNGAGQP